MLAMRARSTRGKHTPSIPNHYLFLVQTLSLHTRSLTRGPRGAEPFAGPRVRDSGRSPSVCSRNRLARAQRERPISQRERGPGANGKRSHGSLTWPDLFRRIPPKGGYRFVLPPVLNFKSASFSFFSLSIAFLFLPPFFLPLSHNQPLFVFSTSLSLSSDLALTVGKHHVSPIVFRRFFVFLRYF